MCVNHKCDVTRYLKSKWFTWLKTSCNEWDSKQPVEPERGRNPPRQGKSKIRYQEMNTYIIVFASTLILSRLLGRFQPIQHGGLLIKLNLEAILNPHYGCDEAWALVSGFERHVNNLRAFHDEQDGGFIWGKNREASLASSSAVVRNLFAPPLGIIKKFFSPAASKDIMSLSIDVKLSSVLTVHLTQKKLTSNH